MINTEEIEESCKYLRNQVGSISVLIICGSGLGEHVCRLIDSSGAVTVDYKDIPHFPQSTVPGHAGKLLIGNLKGSSVRCGVMLGRLHYYEGYGMQEITFPIRVMARLGITSLILTNASGSVNLSIRVGDVLIITDHIAFPCLSGVGPLRGEDAGGGQKFLGLTSLWTVPQCLMEAGSSNEAGDFDIKTGVYGYVGGPQFETPAEVRALRLLGVDVVGMSTIPEAIAAGYCGIRQIIGISLVTNECVDDRTHLAHEPSHAEVLQNSAIGGDRIASIIRRVLQCSDGKH